MILVNYKAYAYINKKQPYFNVKSNFILLGLSQRRILTFKHGGRK